MSGFSIIEDMDLYPDNTTTRTQHIKYLTGLPGLGKTNAAIERMVQELNHPSGLETILYVASSVDLLLECLERFKAEVPQHHNRIFPVYTPNKRRENKSHTMSLPSRTVLPTILAIFYRGVENVPESVEAYLGKAKSSPSKGWSNQFIVPQDGPVVILMTHAAFFNLPPLRKFDKTLVLFDEVTKFIANSSKFEFPDIETRDRFLSFFKIGPQLASPSKASSVFCPIKYKGATIKEFKKNLIGEFGSSRYSRIFGSKTEANSDLTSPGRLSLEGLIELMINPRKRVYFQLTKNSPGAQDKKRALSLFEISVPIYAFSHFKEVIIMASHFEGSQMYHLLKRNKYVTLTDITENFIPNYHDRRKQLRDRYKRTVIIPLTNDTRKFSKRSLSWPLVPSAIKSEAMELIADYGEKGEAPFRNMLALDYERDRDPQRQNPLTPAFESRLSSLEEKGFIGNPVHWYIDQALKIIDTGSYIGTYLNCFGETVVIPEIKTKSKRKLDTGDYRPLLTLNEDALDPWRRFTHGDNNMFYTRLSEEQQARFEFLPHHLKGINKFQDKMAILYLAGINPTTALIQFFRAYLPEYDYEEDHAADTCLQCVCRTAIRDVNSPEYVMVIVPSYHLANLLHAKMANLPLIIDSLSEDMGPAMGNLGGSKAVYKTEQERKEAYNTSKRIYNLKQSISNLRDRLETQGHLSIKHQEKLDRYTRELGDLKRKAAQNRYWAKKNVEN